MLVDGNVSNNGMVIGLDLVRETQVRNFTRTSVSVEQGVSDPGALAR